jgi:oxygen-dependent protoporphyrinogen oxidase
VTARRVVVVGAGVTGLATANRLVRDGAGAVDVTVLEASSRVGGLVRTTPFAGLPAVDEAADAFLARVPWARRLAEEVGLGERLTSPTGAHASVWHRGLHPIPGDLMMGVPASTKAFATSGLFSLRGKLRAALEPLLPTTDDRDSIGEYVRARFGDEVQDFLVDPLVGSIYAADTDRFSLAAVPQIAALTAERSMLSAARRARARAAQEGGVPGQVFATPTEGMGALVAALETSIVARGGRIVSDMRVETIERAGTSYVVHAGGRSFDCDAVVLCSPARHTAELLRPLHRETADALSRWTHASVVLITFAIPRNQWPAHLDGSGYLVPKPDQRWVTAASFGSNKWSHWRPADGSMIVRVSLGRDGLDVLDRDDDSLVNLALADMKLHLGRDFAPSHVRVSRWAESFPQYRPGHFVGVERIEHALSTHAPGVVVAGASYRGIGIPACVQQAHAAAEKVLAARPA